jgi:hypothetical protein
MPLTEIPPYLLEAIRTARIDVAVEAAEKEQYLDAIGQLGGRLEAWAADDNFWNSTAEVLNRQQGISPSDLQSHLDEERQLLANALGGDSQLATMILLEAPLRAERPNLEAARIVVVNLRIESGQVVSEKQPRRRLWRAARFIRKAFKGVGGGLLVAADIVIPDPTMLVTVASVWGGVDMILDAATAK